MSRQTILGYVDSLELNELWQAYELLCVMTGEQMLMDLGKEDLGCVIYDVMMDMEQALKDQAEYLQKEYVNRTYFEEE